MSNNRSFNNNTNSFNNTISVKRASYNLRNIYNLGSVDERAKVLAWLSPLEPRTRHDDIRAHRVEHVGDWLLRTEEYQNWFDVRSGEPGGSVLFCYGDPGVGKTYISSLVIDKLCDWAKGQNVAVACFYLDFASQKAQSPNRILSSLLRQVVGGLETIPAKILQTFRDQDMVIGGRKLGLCEIVEMLQDISSSRPVFICIDAVDECMTQYQTKLLDSLKKVVQNSPSTRIFLAGRSHVRDQVEKHLAGRVVAVPITLTKDDITRFLRAKLEEDTTPDAMDKGLEEDILKSIPETVSEIFLLVSLNIKAILGETTLSRRREKLATMRGSLGLGDAYDTTIGRIKAQEGDRARLGMAALMWISHSERPLNVDEICHALAVEIGLPDLDARNVPSIRTVIGCCQGLAAIDKGSSTIRLIHFTLKEYLSRHADLFDGAHSKIAETCLTYLNFRAIKDLSTSPFYDLGGTPLLEYSSLYWGTHMRMELSDRSRCLALKLLDQYDNHLSAELLWKSIIEWYFRSDKPFSALHCISYFGIAEVASHLIRTKRWDVNQSDSAGLTPLMWAARRGHEEVVKLLLQEKHTRPNIADIENCRTVLAWAARNGRDRVVKLLLRRKDVNLDQPDNYGHKPLSLAAQNGHDGVVQLLLGREDVSPYRPDNRGKTPLSLAARYKHTGIVKLLNARKAATPSVV